MTQRVTWTALTIFAMFHLQSHFFLSQILVLHPDGDGDQQAEDQKIAQYPEDGGIQNLESKGAGV